MAEPKRPRDGPKESVLESRTQPRLARIKSPVYKQKRHQPRTVVAFSAFELARKPQATSAICTRIFFMAFFSSWRIRSADTPYLSASSCNVDLLSDNQRSRRIS